MDLRIVKKKSTYLAITYLLSAVGIAATGSLLFFSKPKQTQTIKVQDTLGFVKPEGPDIRVRGEDDATWNKITRDANVYQNDRVFTGQSSTALVNLKDQNHLRVEPNSLIKISDQSKIPIFDIKDGGLFGELKKNAKFFIKSGNRISEFQSQGAVIQIHGKDDKIQLTVLKGEATVRQVASADASNGDAPNTGEALPPASVITVKANQALTIDDKPNGQAVVEDFKVELLNPEPSQVLWDQGRAIDFKWNSLQTNKPSHVEISQDPQFKTVTAQFDSNENHRSLAIPAGHVYFWRVVNENRQDNSPTSSFAFYSLKGPTLEKTMSFERKIDLSGNLAEAIPLKWNDPSMSDSYQVEVSLKENFSNPAIRETTQRTSLEITTLKEGEYFWRVISRHSGRENLISKMGTLRLKAIVPSRKLATAEPGQRVLPASDSELAPNESNREKATSTGAAAQVATENVPASPPLNVEKDVPSAAAKPTAPAALPALKAAKFEKKSYHFEIQTPAQAQGSEGLQGHKANSHEGDSNSFEKTSLPHFAFTLDTSAEESRFEWALSQDFDSARYIVLKPGQTEVQMHRAPFGQFYVRITSRRGKSVAVSETIGVQALLPAPVILSSSTRALSSGYWVIDAKVTPESRASKTKLEVSESPAFGEADSTATSSESIEFNLSSPGRKFIRARRINEEGVPISLPSDVVSIDVPDVVPQALAPVQPRTSSEQNEPFVPNELLTFVNYGFSTLSVVDPGSNGNAALQMSHDIKAGIRDSQRWSKNFESFEDFSLRAVDFQPSTNSSKTLSNTSHVLPHAALGIGHAIGSRFYARYSLGMENNLAIRGLDSSVIAIDSVAEPFANVELQANLYSFEHTDFFTRLSATYLMGAKTSGYDLLSGYQFDGGVFMRQMLSQRLSLEFGLKFSEREQNTSLLKITEQDINFGASLILPLGRGAP